MAERRGGTLRRGGAARCGRGPRNGGPLEVLGVALRLGLTSFGGPIAHVGYFRREYVERRRWLDEHEFGDLVALTQLLPGPASSQLGIAIGTRRAGIAGGIAAWLGFTLPSAAALVAFALLVGADALGGGLGAAGWLHGLKLAAVAVVATAVLAMARTLTPDLPRRGLALAAAVVALLVPGSPGQVLTIAGGALAGRLGRLGRIARTGPDGEWPARVDVGPSPPPVPRAVAVGSLVLLAALLVGLPVAVAWGVGGHPVAIVDGFFRAGALVFGGGHVVLPLLHETVVRPGWVTGDAFLAGYGAAQAAPGPLFTFAAYLGAVDRLAPGGIVGAALALGAIFLPSFLLVFGTLPWWERLRAWTPARDALAGANAAVVGLLLAALVTPVATSAIAAPLDVLVAALGFAALSFARVPPLAVVAAAVALGELLARAGLA